MSDSKKAKFPLGVLIVALLIAAIGASLFLAYSYYNNSIYKPASPPNESTPVNVTIKSGSTSAQIANILYDKGLIKDKNTFRIYLKINELGDKLQAGNYEFNTGMNVEEIVDKLLKGDVIKDSVTVTIPEGYEIKEIAEVLERKGLVKKEEFIEAAQNISFDYDFLKELPDRPVKLEGYLFPDTYEFSKNATAEQIIKKMLNRFDEIFDDEMRQKAASMGLTIDEVVTMASIIEREAKVDEERPLVSAVFYNRLEIGQMLQSCATVQYILGERKEKLLNKDLEIDSPYNTYKNKGLPIGPIANPGKASLDAALNPADVDYLYFVLKDPVKGTHAFSNNYNDFLKDKKKYLGN